MRACVSQRQSDVQSGGSRWATDRQVAPETPGLTYKNWASKINNLAAYVVNDDSGPDGIGKSIVHILTREATIESSYYGCKMQEIS